MVIGKNEFIFATKSAQQAANALKRAFMRVFKEAKIPYGYANEGPVPHTLRHSAATYLSSVGFRIPDIAAILGHEAVTMSLKYAHSTPEGISKAIIALSNFGVRLEAESIPDMPNMPSRNAEATGVNA